MKKIKGIFVLSVAIAMLAAILAQAQSGQAGSGRYDAQIEQAVTRLLGSKDKWEGITGSTDDGIVTLQGRAKLLIDKLDAGKKVDKVEHVQGVRNHVEVDSSVSDQQLGEQLADRLRYDRVGYGIINVLPVSAMDDDILKARCCRKLPVRRGCGCRLSMISLTPGVVSTIASAESREG
ncbi:MAG: BON domain-containing protein [Acidobacteria bacterium]|nr:BON domain-containing protein [Acidobacteriota bacterium]